MLGAGNVRTARGGQIASQPPTTRHERTPRAGRRDCGPSLRV
jgi:hypothetical protein